MRDYSNAFWVSFWAAEVDSRMMSLKSLCNATLTHFRGAEDNLYQPGLKLALEHTIG